jgi:hypothetical protein
MPDKGKGTIDSPMTPFKGVPSSYTEAPGEYSKHPNVGPAGETGGVPLKFYDNSVKGIMPEGPSMEPTPAKVTQD